MKLIRQITFLVFALLAYTGLSGQCTYDLQLDDTFGDGWNGGQLQVTIAGVSTTYTLGTGLSTQTIPLTVNGGDAIVLEWLGGSTWNGECSFTLFNTSGGTEYASGTGPFTGVHFTGTAVCPSCSAPMSLAAGSVTSNSASLSWTASGTPIGFEIEYGPAGFTPGSGTIVNTTSNPYSLTGLSDATGYDFYLRQICAVGDTSSWVGPELFTTTLGPLNCTVGVASTFFSEDFEGGFPAGWSQVATSDPDWTWDGAGSTPSGGTGPTGAYSGSGFMFLETSGGAQGASDQLISPAIDLTNVSSPARLLFYYHMHGGDIGTLEVDISTNGGATWTNEFSVTGQQQAAQADPWQVSSIDLSAYLGNSILIRFVGSKGGTSFQGDISIDLVEIESCITCPAPTSLASANVTSNAADISWIENGSAANWQLEYGPVGFTPGTGTIINTTTNPTTLTGLTDLTNYEVYVRSVCGAGDTSAWTGPNTFVTLIAPLSCGANSFLDTLLQESFEGGFPASWSKVSNSNPQWTYDGSGGTSSGNTGPSGAYDGSGYLYLETSGGSAGNTDSLYSPILDLTSATGDARMLFYYHMYGATMGTMGLEITTDAGATWTPLWSLSGQQQTDELDPWQLVSVNLSAYLGSTVQFRFYGSRGSSFTGDMALDLVTVEACISCPSPFTYPSTDYCLNDGVISPIISPIQTGSFSEITGNLDLNATTGDFLTDSSTVGTYDIVFNSTLNPACSASDTFTINLLTTDTADIAYPSTSYCYGDGMPMPMNMGTVGGAYSTASLNLNVDANTGAIVIDAASEGVHAVFYTTPNACSAIDTFIVTISAADTADISYMQTAYCPNDANPMAMINGDNNGLFSAGSGLMIDPISGEIMLGSSTVGSYDVVYTTQGQCPDMDTVSITINTLDDATFAYDSTTFCQGSAAPNANITGTTGGTFSATGIMVDPATGAIDLANAPLGAGYDITYTTTGACPASSSVSVNITDCSTVISNTTAVELSEETVNLYPNPNQGQFNIEWLGADSDAIINVYNSVGQQVMTKNLFMQKDAVYSMNLNDLAAGSYVVQIQTATKMTTIKMIVTRS